jgi:tRNA1Val (adenine37-N6)-methyltransferase
MANSYFNFRQFVIYQDRCAFKVGTDGVLLGASADVSSAKMILDVGTGTGILAIMTAQRSSATITAIEPDRESFLQACLNVRKCPWSDRITVENVSLQQFETDSRYDLIIANPPYFSDSLKNPDPVRAASRHNFNLNNDDLLSGVKRLLAENGIFQVIMPYSEGMILIAEAADYRLYCNALLKIRPLPSSEIRRLIITFSGERKKPSEKILTIEHGKRHEFTEEYINLTREFYPGF